MKSLLETILILFQASFLGKGGPVWSLILPKTIRKYMCLFFAFQVKAHLEK